MLYRQKFDTFIRQYENCGYITNKNGFGDRVVDASGAVFLSALSREPQTLEALCVKISKVFVGVEPTVLAEDAKEFYTMLEHDGFIVSGETTVELDQKDIRFSYSFLNPKNIKKDFTSVIRRAEKSSQEYLEEHFKSNPKLMSLQIELTSRCNERCVHCYIPHENKLSDIDTGLFYDTLDQCQDMGVLELTLSGGEPLLHENFCEFMSKAKSYDFSITVLSNLTLLNDDIITVMKNNRLSSVQVSLYSMNPDIHDSITKLPGSFYKTKESIIRLIENNIPLQISCPTMKQNKNCYVDVLNWAYEHKCRPLTDYIMMAQYDHNAGNLNNRLSLDEVGSVINSIINNNLKYQQQILREDFFQEDRRDRSQDQVCGVCITSICMEATGNVYPCPGWQGYICGNLRETTLQDIWENSSKVKYLRNLRKKDFSKCQGCDCRAFCSMCMVRNANENQEMSVVGTLGDPLIINEHFCEVAKLNRKIVMEWREKTAQTFPNMV